MRKTKTQVSLRVCTVFSGSSILARVFRIYPISSIDVKDSIDAQAELDCRCTSILKPIFPIQSHFRGTAFRSNSAKEWVNRLINSNDFKSVDWEVNSKLNKQTNEFRAMLLVRHLH